MPVTVEVPVDGRPMSIYVEDRVAAAAGPAVLLMFHRTGLDHFVRFTARVLARAGYRVAVPDVTHRAAPELPVRDRKQFLTDRELAADIRAAVGYLRSRRDVHGDRIAVMGHCMGGRNALLGAAAVPDLKGAVVYYGGDVFKPWGTDGQAPGDRAAEIRCPVLGFFGGLDKNPSPQDVDRLEAEFAKHGVVHRIRRYPDVGHSFQQNAHRSPAERVASRDSWQKTLAFLNSVLPIEPAAAPAPVGGR